MSKPTVFDLRQHSSTDLDSLDTIVRTGMDVAAKMKVDSLVEVAQNYLPIIEAAKKEALEREADQFIIDTKKDILGN